jgi:hypothetical protein
LARSLGLLAALPFLWSNLGWPNAMLPFGRLVLGLRRLGDVVAGIRERDKLASAEQGDRIVKGTLPTAMSPRFSPSDA